MKIYCSHPNCSMYHEVPWLAALIIRIFDWYLCPDHRYTEEDWEDVKKVMDESRSYK